MLRAGTRILAPVNSRRRRPRPRLIHPRPRVVIISIRGRSCQTTARPIGTVFDANGHTLVDCRRGLLEAQTASASPYVPDERAACARTVRFGWDCART